MMDDESLRDVGLEERVESFERNGVTSKAHTAMKRSLDFAMLHLMPHVHQAEPNVQRQLVLDALQAGATDAAHMMSKGLDDRLFWCLVEDTGRAKDLFENWDVTDALNAVAMTHVPSIFCAWVKHTLLDGSAPRRSLREELVIHEMVYQLVCQWPWRSVDKIRDGDVRKTPLMMLLKWMFTNHTRLEGDDLTRFREARQKIVHPAKQAIEYAVVTEKSFDLSSVRPVVHPWSLVNAPSVAVVPSARAVSVPTTGRVSAVRCSVDGLPAHLQAKINYLETVKGATAAHIANQTLLDRSKGFVSMVPLLQLISNGTRDRRVVEQLCDWMVPVTRLPLGFSDRCCVTTMRCAFQDVSNHRFLSERASLPQLQRLADYWYTSVLARVRSRLSPSDTYYDANGLGSGLDMKTTMLRLAGVWDDVINDSTSSEEMKSLFERVHVTPEDDSRECCAFLVPLLYMILRDAVANSNSALLELCIRTIRAKEDACKTERKNVSIITVMAQQEHDHNSCNPRPSILGYCVNKCPSSFKSLLGLGIFERDARAQALCKAMIMEVDELVTMLVETFEHGDLPTTLPKYTKECFSAIGGDAPREPFLAWTMKNAPRYLPALLNLADQPRSVYKDLLKMCDPNKADTIPVAEWLMMPPVALTPPEDKPWLTWLNQRLYAPGGAGFARVQAAHPDMDGSQHEAKLGSSSGVAPKRARTH